MTRQSPQRPPESRSPASPWIASPPLISHARRQQPPRRVRTARTRSGPSCSVAHRAGALACRVPTIRAWPHPHAGFCRPGKRITPIDTLATKRSAVRCREREQSLGRPSPSGRLARPPHCIERQVRRYSGQPPAEPAKVRYRRPRPFACKSSPAAASLKPTFRYAAVD